MSAIPTVSAENHDILSSYYRYYSHPMKSNIMATWIVNSGPNIDFYIFTASQYSSWMSGGYLTSAAAVYKSLNSAGGVCNRVLSIHETYYVIFSNVDGGSTSNVDITVNWIGIGIPGFELVALIVGLLIVIFINLYKKPKLNLL